ncbi:MAG TPA: hypothetical protein PK210_05000 [Bacteroidia bacterium]|nr:hypothetical protein [Bacteroidia bacterium]
MENLLSALKVLGLSDSDIEALKAEKLPEGTTVEGIINGRVNDLIAIHNQKNPPNNEEKIREARIAGQKDIKQKIGREVLKMEGISRNDLEKMDTEEFIKKTTEHLNNLLEKAGSGTDETMKKELNEYKQKFLKASDELDDIKSSSKHAIEQAQQGAESRIREYKVNDLKEKLLSSYEYGITDKNQLQLALDGVRAKLNSMPWKVNSDSGDLSGEKDGDLAINFSGDGHFKTLKDATDFLVAPLLKRSNAGSEVVKKGNIQVEASGDVAKAALDKFMERNAPVAS